MKLHRICHYPTWPCVAWRTSVKSNAIQGIFVGYSKIIFYCRNCFGEWSLSLTARQYPCTTLPNQCRTPHESICEKLHADGLYNSVQGSHCITNCTCPVSVVALPYKFVVQATSMCRAAKSMFGETAARFLLRAKSNAMSSAISPAENNLWKFRPSCFSWFLSLFFCCPYSSVCFIILSSMSRLFCAFLSLPPLCLKTAFTETESDLIQRNMLPLHSTEHM